MAKIDFIKKKTSIIELLTTAMLNPVTLETEETIPKWRINLLGYPDYVCDGYPLLLEHRFEADMAKAKASRHTQLLRHGSFRDDASFAPLTYGVRNNSYTNTVSYGY